MTPRTCAAVFASRGGGPRTCSLPVDHTGPHSDACECHDAATRDASWFALSLVGYQEDPPALLELRNCNRCGTTRSRYVDVTSMVRTVNRFIRLQRMIGNVAKR